MLIDPAGCHARIVGDTHLFDGCNVQIQNGAGYNLRNGKGNLIVGYNRKPNGLEPQGRSGTHNVVVGSWHVYEVRQYRSSAHASLLSYKQPH